ncbi:MAG TPA: zinc ribbon domain-containing protein, partial [Candidatus Binataceae bacterium]|nr:zinc ribbon domain-containing protein [Candidatus Binataceae bacterium]
MPGPIDYSKITIYPSPDTAEWWGGTKEGRLLVRECRSCGYLFFPPYPMCARCNSMDLGWR